MKFSYKAQAIDGKVSSGTIEANDKFEAARLLKQQNLTALVVETAKEGGGLSGFAKLNQKFSTVKLKEKIFFASNLSEMINAGLPLSRALGVIGRQAKNPKLKSVVAEISSDIDKGGNFADSLKKHPKVFSSVFVAMVGAGEKSGQLPQSLKVVADQLNKSYTLRRKVKGALIYPSIIFLAMILIGIAMLVYIVPTLKKTFDEIGAELPITTKLVIGFSDFLLNHPIVLLAGLVFSVLFLIRFIKTQAGKKTISFVTLHMPGVKSITHKINSAVTARTLASLVSSGVDIVESLKITEDVVQNYFYKKVLQEAQTSVTKGETLSSIFQKSEKLYPPFVGEMASVGEETGKLTEMLEKLAVFYENEVDAAMKGISTVIEPIIMIVVGAAVGFFALSMIQPIYSIGENI